MFRLPSIHNHGYSKIPAVFRQKDCEWAQFDGSVKYPSTRSGLAAMTAVGSVDNLSGLGVARNIRAAADYTVDQLVGPTWRDVFPAGRSRRARRPAPIRATSKPSDSTRSNSTAAASSVSTARAATAGPTRPPGAWNGRPTRSSSLTME